LRAKVVKDFHFEGRKYKNGEIYDIKPIPSRLPEANGVYVEDMRVCDVGSPMFGWYFELID